MPRTWKIDPRPSLTNPERLAFPTPRQELRRILRQRYGKNVQLGGIEGSVFFLDANGEYIEGTPSLEIRRMLRGDMEWLLSEVARVVPFTPEAP